jgi:uncharacterized protein YqeY
MSEIKARLQEAVKEAMRSGDKQRLGTLRMASAAIKQREVDSRAELGDDEVIEVLSRLVKQSRESLEHYEGAGRDDLAAPERAQIEVVSEFLPAALSDDELDGLIDEAINATGAASVRDMGQVMGQLKPRVQGRADMGSVSARVKARLGGG